MKKLAFVFALFAFTPAIAMSEDCFNCGADSSGACDGANQCRGTREHCREIGCKISGTASCSDAANVKICSNEVGTGPQMSVAVFQTPAY